jgi:hypothetical protein
VYWIDCPSCFDRQLDPASLIAFTHHHFLGASHLSCVNFFAEVWTRREEIAMLLARGFTFDVPFEEDFILDRIRAHHIGGHTPGFTVYVYRGPLFVCDHLLRRNGAMIYNPCGPREENLEGGENDPASPGRTAHRHRVRGRLHHGISAMGGLLQPTSSLHREGRIVHACPVCG